MSLEALLRPKQDYLERLILWRVQLDQENPAIALSGLQVEGVLYGLTGTVNVYVDGQYGGSFGQRRTMQEEMAQAMRFKGTKDIMLTLSSSAYAADLLWITCADDRDYGIPSVYRHSDDAAWHTVGEGTHLRRVAEVPTPHGCAIFCGETHNLPGGWSSWPPHATPEDIERFTNGDTTHEELMFFICDAPGVAQLRGVYTGNVMVNKYQEIYNGTAHVVPLGSHAIVAGPGASLSYVWAYQSTALQKSYNKFGTDLSTYIK